MKKWIDLEYEIGDMVYLKTDPDQYPRIVTAVTIRPSGVVYELSFGESMSGHHDFEISKTKGISI